MMYVLVDNDTNKAEIYHDATQIAPILGISTRTLWYHNKKSHIKRGKYILYYVNNGVKKSNRGKK